VEDVSSKPHAMKNGNSSSDGLLAMTEINLTYLVSWESLGPILMLEIFTNEKKVMV